MAPCCYCLYENYGCSIQIQRKVKEIVAIATQSFTGKKKKKSVPGKPNEINGPTVQEHQGNFR